VGNSPRPRVNYNDSTLERVDRKYHRSIRRERKPIHMMRHAHPSFFEGSALSTIPWVFGKDDQSGWNATPTRLPEKTLDALRSRRDVPGKQVVYLTYDDGLICEDRACSKHRDFLDQLDYLGVKVSMFVITNTLEKDLESTKDDPRRWYHLGARDIIKEYVARGHAIGSHTHDHPPLDTTSFQEVESNIAVADEMLRRHAGLKTVRHFRAPFLKVNDQVVDYLVNTMGYKVWGSIIGGNGDWQEWELPSYLDSLYAKPMAKVVQKALDKDEATKTFSSVLCLHDRPHELQNIGRVVENICRVCPRCEFMSLDG